MKKVKLLLLAKNIDGGTGTFFTSLLKNKKLGKTVGFKPLVLETPKHRRIEKRFKIYYFAKNNTYPIKYAISLKNFNLFIKEFFWYRNQIKEFNPDVILSIDTHCGLITEIVKIFLKNKPKTLISIHNNIDETLTAKTIATLKPIIKILISRLFSRADRVICVSRQLSKNLKEAYKLKKIPQTIYLGIKTKKTTKKPQNKVKIILSAARMAEQKDHQTLISAFARLAKKRKDIRLWLVGDGPLKKDIKHQAKKEKIFGRITFFGWVKNLDPYLDKADIFVLSSKREGLPYVLLEAMSHGLPVIATDCRYGPKEILDNGRYGFLFRQGDVKELAKLMEKLAFNDKLRTTFSEISRARSYFFSEDKMIKQYQNLFLKGSEENPQ